MSLPGEVQKESKDRRYSAQQTRSKNRSVCLLSFSAAAAAADNVIIITVSL